MGMAAAGRTGFGSAISMSKSVAIGRCIRVSIYDEN
jgi:hypothetical protein